MIEQKLRDEIFDLVTDQTCKKCEFWDWQGHYCFLKDIHQDTKKCKLLDSIITCIEKANR